MEQRDAVFEAANRRGAQRLRKSPVAKSVRYNRRSGRVVIQLRSGLELAFRPHDVEGLENAKPEQLAEMEISPSGLGVHFPRLDADIYLPALLECFLGSRRWIAAENGRLGGKASTRAKAAAARVNGMLGGRPKKKRDPVAA